MDQCFSTGKKKHQSVMLWYQLRFATGTSLLRNPYQGEFLATTKCRKFAGRGVPEVPPHSPNALITSTDQVVPTGSGEFSYKSCESETLF